MNCPSCDSEVADDAAVCPSCDAVLDPSLFDVAPPDDDAPPPPPKKPKVLTKGVKKVAPKPGAKPGVKKKPAPKKQVEEEVVEKGYRATTKVPDWRDQVSEEDWKANAGREKEAFVVDRTLDANEAMGETKRYLLELGMADKLALFGTAVMVLATFLPWKEVVPEGDVLGVFSSGILVTVLGSVALAGIIIRTRKAMPSLNPILPWMAQLGAVGLSGVWCLVYMKTSWDSTEVQAAIGNYTQWASKPVFGLFLALISAIVSIVGTIFGLKDLGR
jgi:hypothetical protein